MSIRHLLIFPDLNIEDPVRAYAADRVLTQCIMFCLKFQAPVSFHELCHLLNALQRERRQAYRFAVIYARTTGRADKKG